MTTGDILTLNSGCCHRLMSLFSRKMLFDFFWQVFMFDTLTLLFYHQNPIIKLFYLSLN